MEESHLDSLIQIGQQGVVDGGPRAIPLLREFVDFPWVQDGFTLHEYEAIRYFRSEDASIVYDLVNRQDRITDDDVTLIAALRIFRSDYKQFLGSIQWQVETLAQGTELSPDLKVSIVRAGSGGNPKTIGAARDAVAFVENTMGLPLPLDHVIIVAHDWTVESGVAGKNDGFVIGIGEVYDRDVGQYAIGFPEGLIAHEVAHYFWRGNAGWLDEGIADLIQFLYSGTGIFTSRPDGCSAFTLSEINHWHCNYYLGFILFRGLQDRMGSGEFWASLRELYRLSLDLSDLNYWERVEQSKSLIYQVFSEHTDYLDGRFGE